jgi:hypothetical protein
MPDATTTSCGLPRVELDDDLLADPTHIDQGSLRAGSGRRTRPTLPVFMFNGVALRFWNRWNKRVSGHTQSVSWACFTYCFTIARAS